MTKPALTVILALGAALVATPTPAADRKLPSKFVGDWCAVNSQSWTHERGRRCRESDAWMTVNVNGFRGHEGAAGSSMLPPFCLRTIE